MLRLYRGSGRRGAALLGKETNGGKTAAAAAVAPVTRLMGTQSGDDARPPTALARLHLEDGSTLTGRSFGSHESVSGEVCPQYPVLFVVHYLCGNSNAFIVIFLLLTLLSFHSSYDDRLFLQPAWLVIPRR